MGIAGAQFGQQYSQAGVQQMGTPGVNGQQLQNKTALSNNLPQFPTELKGAGSVPNMVSVKPSLCFPVWVVYQEFLSGLFFLLLNHSVFSECFLYEWCSVFEYCVILLIIIVITLYYYIVKGSLICT